MPTWAVGHGIFKTTSSPGQMKCSAFLGLTGCTFTGRLDDVINQSIHPEDRQKVDESNRLVAQEGKPIPLEYRIIRPDNSVRTVWAEAGEMIKDAQGKPIKLSGIVQDITERKIY